MAYQDDDEVDSAGHGLFNFGLFVANLILILTCLDAVARG